MSQILLFLTAFSRLRQTCLVSFMVSLTGRNREVFHLCGAGARQCMRWPWNFLTPHVVRALLLRSSRELEKEILSPVHESWTRVTSRLERAFTTGELVNTISTSPLERSITNLEIFPPPLECQRSWGLRLRRRRKGPRNHHPGRLRAVHHLPDYHFGHISGFQVRSTHFISPKRIGTNLNTWMQSLNNEN